MESQKTNIKRAIVTDADGQSAKDIYIVDGTVKMIREEIRQSVFSGVYEMDADGLFACPFFTDSACFALGEKSQGLPRLSEPEYKRFGFFSLVTLLNPADHPARLYDQRESVKMYAKSGMSVRYLTGGTFDKVYHLGENVYADIVAAEDCIGASALIGDSAFGLDTTRFIETARQVNAVRFDTERNAVLFALLGDAARDFGPIAEAVHAGVCDETTIVPVFVNRNKALMNTALAYRKAGGYVVLVAGSDAERMQRDVVPLSQALVRFYEATGDLSGVLAGSFSGGLLPKKDGNSLDVRGDIANLSAELAETAALGVPMAEVLRCVTENPIEVFGLQPLKIEMDGPARFLLVDKDLNVRSIVLGNQIYPPGDFNTPLLYL